MAAVTLALSGYPPVYSARVFQKSTAEPGVIIAHMSAGAGTDLPATTTLTCTARAFSGTWAGLKMKSKPRIFRGNLQMTFKDSKSAFEDFSFIKNYNIRNVFGDIDAETEKTIDELWDIIELYTGLTFIVQNPPMIKPTMLWEGMTGEEGANKLLCETGMRLVYNPTDQTYYVQAGDKGDALDTTERMFGEPASSRVKQVHVDSDPVLYEGLVDAEAVVENSFGDLVTIETVADPIDIFNAYQTIPNITERWRYKQSALRLWRVTGTDFPEGLTPDEMKIYDSRAVAISFGSEPVQIKSHVKGPGLATFPHYQFVEQDSSYDDRGLTIVPGRNVFTSETPVISVDVFGDIRTTVEIVASYQIVDGVSLRRNRETADVNVDGREVTIVIPWLKPIESELPDAVGIADDWKAIHKDVVSAIAALYSTNPRSLAVAKGITPGNNGTVGGLLYEFIGGRRGHITTTMAIGFVPANWRSFSPAKGILS